MQETLFFFLRAWSIFWCGTPGCLSEAELSWTGYCDEKHPKASSVVVLQKSFSLRGPTSAVCLAGRYWMDSSGKAVLWEAESVPFDSRFARLFFSVSLVGFVVWIYSVKYMEELMLRKVIEKLVSSKFHLIKCHCPAWNWDLWDVE